MPYQTPIHPQRTATHKLSLRPSNSISVPDVIIMAPPKTYQNSVVRDEDTTDDGTASSDGDGAQMIRVPRSMDHTMHIQDTATKQPNVRPETYTTIATTQRNNINAAHTLSPTSQSHVPHISTAIGAPQPPCPNPLNSLPPLLAKFCAYGADQYANCADFTYQKPEIWARVESLPSIASQFLIYGDMEAATRVVSRYLMLKGAMKNPTNLGRSKWLKQLDTDPQRAKKFEESCDVYLGHLSAQIATAHNRHSVQLTHRPHGTSQNVNIPYSEKSNQAPIGSRRLSMSSGGSRPGTYGATIPPPVDRLAPLPKFDKPLKYQASEQSQSDMDSGILPGGKAYIGLSGPKTDMIQDWPNNLRDKLYADFRLHTGRPSINATFETGCLIAVLWHENLGHSIPHKFKDKVATEPEERNLGKGFLTIGPKGENIYSHVRRFVFVVRRHGHSIGIPITSYSNKGLSAKTLSNPERRAHAIIYAEGTHPETLGSEPEFTKPPICVKIEAPGETLSSTSRLYYAKPQSIDHNIKVKYIGRVIEKDLRRLVLSFKTELFPDNDD